MTSLRLAQFAGLALSLNLAGCAMISNPFSASGSAPAQPLVTMEKDIHCPDAQIRDGGAVLRNGKGPAVSSQLTIRTVVRECVETGDGLTVKVGIEGVAVIGAAGKPGPVSGPITITIDRDGKTLSTRATVAKANIGADGNAIFSLVEDGFKIPAGDDESVISVGFKK